MLSKPALRQDYIKRRQAIDSKLRQIKDTTVFRQAVGGIDWKGVARLHIYGSRSQLGEVDTSAIIKHLSELYPDLTIDIVGYKADAPQPASNYDVIIVPVLAYDNLGNRLGMGQGWYDRFLASQPQALKVGLAYTESFIDRLPVESHDQALDIIYAA